MGHDAHDKLFKWTFSQVEHAAGELQQMLPPALAARIDLTTLTLCPGSFIDDAFKDRHTDLLFSVSVSGRSAFVYVLFEHQSYADPLMPFRIVRYLVRIWEKYLVDHPNAKRLPAIIPLVVHHSETGWTGATAFEELLDVDAETLAELGEHVPRFRFLLDDVSLESDAALKARTMSALGRLVLWCLRSARTPGQIVQNIGGWVDLIREVRQAPNGAAALTMVWRYIFAVHKRYKPEELLTMLTEAVGKEADDDEELLSVADQLIERGLQKGQRKVLLKLLSVRFGTPPEAAVARVNAADIPELDLWTERVLTAPTLADVLGDA